MDYIIINIRREGQIIYYFNKDDNLICSNLYDIVTENKRKYIKKIQNDKYRKKKLKEKNINDIKITKEVKKIKIDF